MWSFLPLLKTQTSIRMGKDVMAWLKHDDKG
jgi:hypothetical protein